MANYADCRLVTDKNGNSCIVAVMSARPDGLKGCYYTLHSPKGAIVGHGHSAGRDGSGMGSALTAMQNGRAAAKRWLVRQTTTATTK